MALTYYDMEKLMRMVYDQKLSASMRKIEIRRSRITWNCVPPCERVPRQIRPKRCGSEIKQCGVV